MDPTSAELYKTIGRIDSLVTAHGATLEHFHTCLEDHKRRSETRHECILESMRARDKKFLKLLLAIVVFLMFWISSSGAGPTGLKEILPALLKWL